MGLVNVMRKGELIEALVSVQCGTFCLSRLGLHLRFIAMCGLESE